MAQECSFYLANYDSPSGYFRRWETDGKSRPVEYPYSGKKGPNWLIQVDVHPGQHLLLVSKPDDSTPTFARLIEVPSDENSFRIFCEQSQKAAGQNLYDQIIRYKHGPRFRPPRLQEPEDDFFGDWLDNYVIREWQEQDDGVDEDSEIPYSLSEALQT